jgi:hypothetical protein
MLAREDDVLMIPIIGIGFRVVEEGIVPSMVVWDDTLSWFKLVTTLMGQCTIFALVSIQETRRSTPVTGSPFLSFWWGWEVVRPSGAWER